MDSHAHQQAADARATALAMEQAKLSRASASMRGDLMELMGTASRSMALAFKSAERGGRLDRNRYAPSGSRDWIYPESVRLRLVHRSRDMERNDPVFAALLDRAVELVVGDGLRPEPATASREWNDRADELFTAWAERCDITGELSFWDSQATLFRSSRRDGDMLALRTSRGVLQFIESERCTNPDNRLNGTAKNGNLLRDGVEIDPAGQRVAYYVGDYDAELGATLTKWTRIEARHAMMFSAPKPVSQTRGVPVFAPALVELDRLDMLREATIIAGVVQAFFAAAIKVDQPAGQATMYRSTTRAATGAALNGADGVQHMEPGSVFYLQPGESVEAIESKHPSSNAAEFSALMVRLIGAAVGVPPELGLFDFRQSNFSQSKALMAFIYRRIRAERERLRIRFGDPVYRWKIAQFIRDGKLEHVADWQRVAWRAPAVPMLDPARELLANRVAIESRQRSPQSVIGDDGRDWREVVDEIAEFERYCEEKGVAIVHTPGASTTAALSTAAHDEQARQGEEGAYQ